MIEQKQNIKQRYHQSWAIVLLWILLLVFIIRVGILLQRSEFDFLLISNQIKSESSTMSRQRSHTKISHPLKKPIPMTTWENSSSTWSQTHTGIKIETSK